MKKISIILGIMMLMFISTICYAGEEDIQRPKTIDPPNVIITQH